jgi:MFS family permease
VINLRAAPCDEAAIRSIPPAANCVARQKPWVLLATILASSITYIDESVVNIALPSIESNLATSVAVVQWLVNAYTLCLSALLLTGGVAADRFGRRKMFIIGIILFAAASLWCGFAPSVAQLILARAMQGVGAAILIPCSLALIGASFDEEERGKAIGTWAGVSAIAVAIGPLLGGLIVDHFSWRWIFLINPLLALPTIWIVYKHVPESHDHEATGRLDWTGPCWRCSAWLAFVSASSRRRNSACPISGLLCRLLLAYCCFALSFGWKGIATRQCCRLICLSRAPSQPLIC